MLLFSLTFVDDELLNLSYQGPSIEPKSPAPVILSNYLVMMFIYQQAVKYLGGISHPSPPANLPIRFYLTGRINNCGVD
jgi:hypothetical protein